MGIWYSVYFFVNLYYYFIELIWTTTITNSPMWTQVCFALLTITPILMTVLYMITLVRILIIFLRALMRYLHFLRNVLLWIRGMCWTCCKMLQTLKEYLSRLS
nr:TPA_asm: P overlapped [Tolmeia alphacytorhabdovirus 1]